MEGKVLLYDANDAKIGQTFLRRAKQLVKQQRAAWIGDRQEAIRFFPGMEHLDEGPAVVRGEVHSDAELDAVLMRTAKHRVYTRFAFNLHRLIAFLLCALFVVIYVLTDPGGYFWPIWPIMGLGISVIIHWVVYKFINENEMKDKIAIEYERLKNMRHY